MVVFQRAGEAPGCVLEALQQRSEPQHSTTGIMPGYITIQTSAGSPPTLSLSLSALQFHNKHIMETKSFSIIYNSTANCLQ